jgi:hypothetical protein
MPLYFHEGSYMFRQNNAILREQLDSFLSYFKVNVVGGKSEYNKIIKYVWTKYNDNNKCA